MTTIRIGDLTVNRLGFGAMRVCGPQIWSAAARLVLAPEDLDALT